LYSGDLDYRGDREDSAWSRVAQSPARIERRLLRPPGPLFRRDSGIWVPREPSFREDLYRAREIRGDFSFGEQILDIADDGSNDWTEAKNGGAPRVNKEVVLRSKLRIEARQFHMSRLHPQQWGERQQIDVKNDWSVLTEEERSRKADELIAMIRELKEPPMQPPPLVYRAEEPPEEPEPLVGSQTRRATWSKS
jgi:hypothetical protein